MGVGSCSRFHAHELASLSWMTYGLSWSFGNYKQESPRAKLPALLGPFTALLACCTTHRQRNPNTFWQVTDKVLQSHSRSLG